MNEREYLKLFVAGDVMTGRGIDQILPHPGDPTLHESYLKDAHGYVHLAERANGPIGAPVDYRYIWGDALQLWQAHDPDLRIVNLETAVTASHSRWPEKAIHYRMHPRNVACLTEARLDCCVLANNHILDWGYEGLEDTVLTLRSAGIAAAGAGTTIAEAVRPARLSVAGRCDVLVFGAAHVSSGVSETWRADGNFGGVFVLDALDETAVDRVAELVRPHRHSGEIVVLSIHWGDNWGYDIPGEQRRFARRVIDTGLVDIVHGHSSHHPRAIEFYRGKLVLYGCGDLINDYEGIGGHDRFRPWLASLYFLTVDPGTRSVKQVEIEVLRVHRFQLKSASVDDRRWLTDRLTAGGDFATVVESRAGALVARPGRPEAEEARHVAR